MKKAILLSVLLILCISALVANTSSNLIYHDFWENKPSFETVSEELLKGDDINKVTKDGITALMYALANSADEQIIQLLINNNADVTLIDNSGRTALLYALWKNYPYSTIKLLLDNGADVNQSEPKSNLNSLLVAVSYNQDSDVVKLLLENDVDTNQRSTEGWTAWELAAAQTQNPYIITLLIEELELTQSNINNMLFHACRLNSNLQVIKELIGLATNTKTYYSDGSTLLMKACETNSNPDIIRELIVAGALINSKDSNNKNALYYARRNPNIYKTPIYWSLVNLTD